MAKIWLKIWLKVKENGTKKIRLAKMVAKEKKNPSANPANKQTRKTVYLKFSCLHIHVDGLAIVSGVFQN